jgi:predicted ester cyclase
MKSLVTLLVILASAAPARAEDAVKLVQSFEATWASGKVEAAAELFTDDAELRVVFDTPPPGTDKLVPDAVFVGREQVAGFLGIAARGLRIASSDWKGDGLHVTWASKARSDAMRHLGIIEAEQLKEAWLRGDKIRRFTIAYAPATAAIAVRAIPAANKAVIRRYHAELNRRNYGVLDEVVAPGLIQHTVMPIGPGLKGLKDFYAAYRTAFPDFQFTLDDVLADGDKVMVRMTIRATHRGDFMGVKASGKPVTFTKMDIFRIFNGKILEHWDNADRLSLLQQLGVVQKLPTWERKRGDESGFR